MEGLIKLNRCRLFKKQFYAGHNSHRRRQTHKIGQESNDFFLPMSLGRLAGKAITYHLNIVKERNYANKNISR